MQQQNYKINQMNSKFDFAVEIECKYLAKVVVGIRVALPAPN